MKFIHIITALALALSAVACGDDEPEYLEPEQPVQPTPDPEDPEEPEKPDDPVTPPEPEPSRALSLDLPISTGTSPLGAMVPFAPSTLAVMVNVGIPSAGISF